MILVTAATAPVGRALATQLVAAGYPVRALTRDPATAQLPAGVEAVAGDLADPASLAAACAGVSAVFLLAAVPGFAPAFLRAAATAGVQRLVFQSSDAIDDQTEAQPTGIAAFHHAIEQAIRASALDWTFLRLAVASSGALFWASNVATQLNVGDVVRGPMQKRVNRRSTPPILPL